MGDSRFYDQVRLDPPDDLLHCNDVLWKLDDRSTKPSKVICVLEMCGFYKPFVGKAVQLLISSKSFDILFSLSQKFTRFVRHVIPPCSRRSIIRSGGRH